MDKKKYIQVFGSENLPYMETYLEVVSMYGENAVFAFLEGYAIEDLCYFPKAYCGAYASPLLYAQEWFWYEGAGSRVQEDLKAEISCHLNYGSIWNDLDSDGWFWSMGFVFKPAAK